MSKTLRRRDQELAVSVARPSRARIKSRRCSHCEQWYPSDEVYPDVDEEGRRLGWICGSCY